MVPRMKKNMGFDDGASKSAERWSEVPSDVDDELDVDDNEDGEDKKGIWTFLRMNNPSLFEDLKTHMDEGNSLFTYKSLVKMVSKAVGSQDLRSRISVVPDSKIFCFTVEKYEEPVAPVTLPYVLMVEVKEFACVDDSLRQTKIEYPVKLLLSPENKFKKVFRLLVKTGDLVVIWGGVRTDLENETIITLNPWVCPDIVVVSLSLKENIQPPMKEIKRVLKIAELLKLERKVQHAEHTEYSTSVKVEENELCMSKDVDRKSLDVLDKLVKTEENKPVRIDSDSLGD